LASIWQKLKKNTSPTTTITTMGCCCGLYLSNVRHCWKPSVRQLLTVMRLGRVWECYSIFFKNIFKIKNKQVLSSI